MYETIIKHGKQNDVWINDQNRRRRTLKAIDFYNTDMWIYLKHRINKMYPTTGDKVLRYGETYPLTTRVIDGVSVLFQNPVVLDIDKDTLVDDFNLMIKTSKFQSVMNKVNHYVNLTFKVGVMPVYRDGIIDLDIITGDKCFVYQDKLNPTKATDVFVQIDALDQTPSIEEGHIGNLYVRWTNEVQSIVEIDTESGNIIKEYNAEVNPYGVIPITWFSDSISTSTFWPEKRNSLIETNEWVNVDQTNINMVISFQSYSTLVIVGSDDDSKQDIQWGPQALIEFKGDNYSGTTPTADYITPDPKLEQMQKALEQKKVDAATSFGLSANAYRSDTSQASSGYSLKLMNENLIKKLQSSRAPYTASILELLKLMMNVWSYHSTTKVFPEDTIITVNFPEITYDASPLETAQINAIRLSQGLVSPVMLLMEADQDLSRELAQELYIQIQADKRLAVTNGVAKLTDAVLNT